MRNVTGIVTLVISIALALIGCSREPITSTAAPAVEQAGDSQIALTCPAGQRVCSDCQGNLSCATRCTFPLCPVPVAPQSDEASAIAELAPVVSQHAEGRRVLAREL